MQAAVASLLHTSPRKYGIPRTRWRLQDVRRVLSWLQGYSKAGIYKVLKRLGFSRKQALNFIHSPDPDYRAKWQVILRAYSEAVAHPEEVLLLFMDESGVPVKHPLMRRLATLSRGHAKWLAPIPRPV